MGKPYWDELDQIPGTIRWAREQDVSALRHTLLEEFSGQNLLAVGSGGSLAAAAFAAMLHESHSGLMARSTTPLEAVIRPDTRKTAALLVSAQGANPDIQQAARALLSKHQGLAAICTRTDSPLSQVLRNGKATMHEFDLPSGKDGFLATNSLMATLVFLHAATQSPQQAQDGLKDLDLLLLTNGETSPAPFQPTLIVLAQGWATPAALDLEARFSEAALANVTLTDPRNFAHGRHHRLTRRPQSTGVISLSTRDTWEEAERTLDCLPAGISMLRIASERTGPAATIELVAATMELAGHAGDIQGIDPGQPSVQDFGRRLYHAGPAGGQA